MYATETRSATPVTPDSVVGADININGCTNDKVDGRHDDDTSSSTDELLQSILRHESLPHYQLSPDYLHSSVLIPSSEKDQGVSERCRRRTCEWMYDICDYFHLNRDVVAIALFYVDRYFTVTSFPEAGCTNQVPVTRKQFQLVALTGLYIAIKTHGEPRNNQGKNQMQWNRAKFSIRVCASISRHQFTSNAIEKCEHLMLQTLEWRVNPIVPSGVVIDALVNYLSPGSVDGSGKTTGVALYVYDCSKYLAELSVSVPALCMVYKPSVIAYASIMYALDIYGTMQFSRQRRSEYEAVLQKASGLHFDLEKENIKGARGILQAICPNLSELFSSPSKEPGSPNSVKMSDSIQA
jgi:hypothetical protein